MDEPDGEEGASQGHSMIAYRTVEDGGGGQETCLNNAEGHESAVMELVQNDGPQNKMLVSGRNPRRRINRVFRRTESEGQFARCSWKKTSSGSG